MSKSWSFAEVVGLSQNQLEKPKKTWDGHVMAMAGDGFLEILKMTGDGLAPAVVTGDSDKVFGCAEKVGVGDIGWIPVCKPAPSVISTSSKVTSTLSKPGLERLKGRVALEGDGKNMLSVQLELLAIKRMLTNLRREVDVGVGRIDSVLGYLESNGPCLGSSEVHFLGSSET